MADPNVQVGRQEPALNMMNHMRRLRRIMLISLYVLDVAFETILSFSLASGVQFAAGEKPSWCPATDGSYFFQEVKYSTMLAILQVVQTCLAFIIVCLQRCGQKELGNISKGVKVAVWLIPELGVIRFVETLGVACCGLNFSNIILQIIAGFATLTTLLPPLLDMFSEDLEDQVRELRATNTSLNNEVTQLKGQIATQSGELIAKGNEVQGLRDTNTILNNEVTELKGQIARQSGELIAKGNEVQGLRDTNTILNNEVTELKGQIARQSGELTAKDTEVRELRATNTSLNDKVTRLEGQIETQRGELTAKDNEIDREKKKCEEEKEQLRTDLNNKNKELEDLITSLKNERAEKEGWVKKCQELEVEANGYKESLKAKDDKVKDKGKKLIKEPKEKLD